MKLFSRGKTSVLSDRGNPTSNSRSYENPIQKLMEKEEKLKEDERLLKEKLKDEVRLFLKENDSSKPKPEFNEELKALLIKLTENDEKDLVKKLKDQYERTEGLMNYLLDYVFEKEIDVSEIYRAMEFVDDLKYAEKFAQLLLSEKEKFKLGDKIINGYSLRELIEKLTKGGKKKLATDLYNQFERYNMVYHFRLSHPDRIERDLTSHGGQVLIDKLEKKGEADIASDIRGYYKQEPSGGSMIFSKNEYRRINDDIQQFAYTDDNGNQSFEFQQKKGKRTVRQVKGKSTKNGRRIKIQESAPSPKTFQIASTELQPFITGLVTPKRPTTSQQRRRRSSQRLQKGGAPFLRQLFVGFGLMMASALTATATNTVSPESRVELFCKTYGGQIDINALSREQKIRTAITLKLADIGVGLNPDKVCRNKDGHYYLSNDVTIIPGNQIARSEHTGVYGFLVTGNGLDGNLLRWQKFVALNKKVEDTFGTPIWGTFVVDHNFNNFHEWDTRRERPPISAWEDGKTGIITKAKKGEPVDKMVFNPDNFVLIKKEISPEATKHGLYDMQIVVINSDDMYDPENTRFGSIVNGKMVPQQNRNGELIKTNPNFQVLEQLVKDLPALVDAHNRKVSNRMNGIPNDNGYLISKIM